MAGTRISSYGTVGVEITLTSGNPVLVTASGTIDTRGAFALYDAISSAGKIVNHGVLEANSASGVGVKLASGGHVRNFGLISGGAAGIYDVNGTTAVTNDGTITATGTAGIGAWLRTGGSLANGSAKFADSTISGKADGVLMTDYAGKVDNFGTISGIKNNGVEIDNGGGGTDLVVNGRGTGATSLITGGNDGVRFGGSGEVVNDGTIIGRNNAGVSIGGNGTVANGSSAHVDRAISGGNEGIYVGGVGNVTNFGTISGTGTASVGTWLHNGGSLTNGSAAVTGLSITGRADGVLMTNYSGSVENFGKITGASGNGVEIDTNGGGTDTVVNGTGTLSSYLIRGANYGVFFGGSGTVSNDGSLIGTADAGVLIAGSGTVNNGNASHVGRVISGGNEGIFIGTGNVTNFGTISGTGTASVGAFLHNGGSLTNGSTAVTGLSITGGADGVLMTNYSGSVENFGKITGASGNGVEIDTNGGGADAVVNGAGSLSSYLISGANYGVFFGGSGTVSNDGTLIGTTNAGVLIAGSGTVNNGDASHVGRVISGGNEGIFIGAGNVTNFGTISGTGTASAGVILHSGGSLTNGSTAVTGLSITGGADGVLMTNYSGSVENFGTITGASGDGVEIDTNGGGTDAVVNGTGTLSSYLISGANDGVFFGGSGTVSNDGSLIGTTNAGVFIAGSATVNNGDAAHVGRVISGGNEGIFIGAGNVMNFGTISGTGTASVGAVLHSGGSLTNGSTAVTGLSITGGADGVLMTNYGGSVENFGKIIGATNNGVEIDTNGGGTDTVVNGTSKLSNYLISGANDGVFLGGSGTVSNDGKLLGKAGAGVSIGGNGTVTNGDATHVGRVISGGNEGIYIGNAGNVTNFGTISGTGTASVGAWMHNGGSLTNGSTAVTGLSITGGAEGVLMTNYSGSVGNFGTITGASGNGVEIDTNGGGADTAINGTGPLSTYLIRGANDGVFFGGSGTVSNDGSLIGTTNAGVFIAGNGTVNNGDATHVGRVISGGNEAIFIDAGNVTNFGTISGTGTASVGAFLHNGGSLTNGSTAVTGLSITGGADGVLMTNYSGSVENFGKIVGTINNGVEIDTNGGGTDTVLNATGATISGNTGISIGGTGTLTTAGTITGTGGTAVTFGSSSDRLIVEAGAVVNGVVNGGGGSLEFAGGSGSSGSIGTEFVNFSGVGVDVGASWSFSGSNTIAALVDNGSITISASATLDVTGAIDAGSIGIFNLSAGAMLEVMADTGSQDQMSFLGSAELTIDNASQFGAQVGTSSYVGPEIDHFIAGDMIDLKSIALAGATLNYSSSTGLLQVSSDGSDVATLFFQNATLGSGSFHAKDDGSGHLLITHS